MKYIVDIKGEIDGDYEIIGKYEERPQGDLISRTWLKEHKFTTQVCNGVEIEDVDVVGVATIDNAPTVEPTLSDEQIENIADLFETEWGYEGIREDVSRILKETNNVKPCSSCAHFNNGNRKPYPCGSCFTNTHNMWEAKNE